jgi:hypothetical protein
MKKIIFAVMICAIAASAAAEDAKVVKKDYELKGQEGQLVVGALKVVVPSDLTRPTTGLIITDKDGKDVEFVVKPLAVVYNAVDGTMLNLRDIPAGEVVQVSYKTTSEGSRQAMAVKVLPKEQKPAGMDEAVK